MSDVRALLKAKRQEARIHHPYASYTPAGQLRCTACETVIKQASTWAGHVGSKAHRENVAKQRITKATGQQEETTRSIGKRKVGEEEPSDDQRVHSTSESKKPKVTPEDTSGSEHLGTFPSDFFSDPARAPIRSVVDESSDEDEDHPIPTPSVAADNPINLEWQRFQQEMLTPTSTSVDQRHEAFKRATVFAEPELLPESVAGLPSREPLGVDVAAADIPTNDELRKRKEEDEKELIMDRLLEEERAQEEADAKVVLLKGRLEALKKRRNEANAARAKKSQ
jgi:zinc finger protein 830